jgi:hypothetical protein
MSDHDFFTSNGLTDHGESLFDHIEGFLYFVKDTQFRFVAVNQRLVEKFGCKDGRRRRWKAQRERRDETMNLIQIMKSMKCTRCWKAVAFLVLAMIGTAVAEPLSEGTWTSIAYKVAGKWSIEEEGGQLVLKLGKKFKTKSGPDLKVFLTPQTVDSVNGSNATEGALLIAPLKSYESRAAATYPIPAGTDLSKYKAIVIHCEKLSKLWGASAL